MTQIQTDYLPQPVSGNQPIYLRLADAIERDIDNGTLAAGSRLPPMRNLAFDIGVTIGTISRAYNVIAERGLVAGEVGRGTYVLDRSAVPSPAPPTPDRAEPPAALAGREVERNEPLNFDSTAALDVGQAAQFSEMFAQIARSMPQALLDYVHVLPDHWRAAGVRYLSHNGYRPQADAIAAVNGCHAGIMAIMMTVSAPGDKIVFETGTYASIARSVALAGRRIVETPMDDDGILPDEFEKLCARQHPRLLYLMPAVNNPTLARLSGERRAAIVAICRRYNVWIIEDAIYAPLSGDREAPMAALCPELTFHVAGLSKTVSAALRSGWIACPSGFSGRIQSAHRMFSGGNSHVLKELASRVVLSGEADRILARALEVIRHRAAMLAECLDGYDIRINPTCPYAWLRLPEPWLSGAFRNAALERGIMISHEDDFKPSRSGVSFHAVRISFAQRYGDDTYRAAFATIRDLLESGVTGHLAVT